MARRGLLCHCFPLLIGAVGAVRAGAPRSCSTVRFADHGPYHAIVDLPPVYHVHDFTKSKDPQPDGTWSVGKFNEVRPTMYDTAMFDDADKAFERNVDRFETCVGHALLDMMARVTGLFCCK